MSDENIPQMREAIEALQKEVKDKDSQLQKMGQEVRVRDAREAFRKAGYNPKHGDLFAKDNPEAGEIAAEAVASYAAEWDLAPAAAEGASEASGTEGGESDAADDGTDALSGMDRSGTRAGEGGGGSSTEQSLTRQQWMELKGTDPVAAASALRQGRVITSGSGNLKSGQAGSIGANPYATQHVGASQDT